MNRRAETWASRVGRLGLAARGVVFTVIGVFLMVAALTANPKQARGLSGALQALEQQPVGPWALGIVALGLVASGLYMLVLTRYRRIIL
jgi:type IV secretory pathway VirB2 component (pilin)